MHLVLFLWDLLSHFEPEKLDEMSTARLPGLDLPWPLNQFSGYGVIPSTLLLPVPSAPDRVPAHSIWGR